MMETTYDKAIEIVRTLREAGHIAYFAGGWVRDYLLQQQSPDIDIATSAAPEVVTSLFPHTVQVGASFGVIMVIIDNTPFEVATFRKDGLYLYGRRPEGIEFSTPEEDAQRRDFTINGMFYDPLTKKILDYVGGQEDLKKHLVRAIGDPHERFKEDRLRMVRGVRIMARFHFTLERATRDAIAAHATALFPAVAKERVWQEFSKLSEHSGVGRALVTMHELGLLQVIFPQLTGLPLDEIVARTHSLKDFPHPCPAILCLMQLFPRGTAKDFETICQDLRASTKEIQLAAWCLYAHKMFHSVLKRNIKPTPEWIYLYADPRTSLCLEIFAATLGREERRDCLDTHQDVQKAYAEEIARVKEKRPVVTSKHLEQQGILPGKRMGVLLKEAERIAIYEQLNDPEAVLPFLKESALWSKEVS